MIETGATCACGLVTWEDECVPGCVPGADLELKVRANLDPEQGMVATGADGASPAVAADFAHVRRWLLGMVRNIGGQLPAGWDVAVTVNRAAQLEEPAVLGRPDRPPRTAPAVVDRHAAAEQATCAACGLMLRRDRPEDVWYHVPACTDPSPAEPQRPQEAAERPQRPAKAARAANTRGRAAPR